MQPTSFDRAATTANRNNQQKQLAKNVGKKLLAKSCQQNILANIAGRKIHWQLYTGKKVHQQIHTGKYILAFFYLAFCYWQKNPLAKKYQQKLLAKIPSGANAPIRFKLHKTNMPSQKPPRAVSDYLAAVIYELLAKTDKKCTSKQKENLIP